MKKIFVIAVVLLILLVVPVVASADIEYGMIYFIEYDAETGKETVITVEDNARAGEPEAQESFGSPF